VYAIVVYDVDETRVGKVNRFLKKYILWVQNSVFEGELTEKLFEDMMSRLKKIAEDTDSFVVYTFKTKSYTSKTTIGRQKSSLDNVI